MKDLTLNTMIKKTFGTEELEAVSKDKTERGAV